jgi:hypothetical protein
LVANSLLGLVAALASEGISALILDRVLATRALADTLARSAVVLLLVILAAAGLISLADLGDIVCVTGTLWRTFLVLVLVAVGLAFAGILDLAGSLDKLGVIRALGLASIEVLDVFESLTAAIAGSLLASRSGNIVSVVGADWAAFSLVVLGVTILAVTSLGLVVVVGIAELALALVVLEVGGITTVLATELAVGAIGNLAIRAAATTLALVFRLDELVLRVAAVALSVLPVC